MFGERLTQLRKQKGLSQNDLAEAIGISRQAISKYENGLAEPDLDKMGSQHFFGQFAKRLFVKLGHTRKAMLLVQDSLSVLVPLRGCKRSRCKRRLALSDH